MKSLLQRVFSFTRGQQASGKAASSKTDTKLSLAQIQQALLATVSDCTDVSGQRASYKITQAKTAAELWALRSDLHQCIARLYSERVAAARVNDMAELFTGWLPASQLTRIQPGFRSSAK